MRVNSTMLCMTTAMAVIIAVGLTRLSAGTAQVRLPGREQAVAEGKAGGGQQALTQQQQALREALKDCPFKIVHESYRQGNWELILRSADGSGPVNLTNTADIDELYPHASPDGSRIAFVADTGQGDARIRNVFIMDVDGSGRIQVGQNGRQPFWSPDGKILAFLRGERLTYEEGGLANKDMYLYNLATKEIAHHPKKDLDGLLNPCWTPDGKWIVSSVMGGMGFGSSICAIEADGQRVVELRRSLSEAEDIYQCRPDVSPNGKWVAWGKEDCEDFMWLEVADFEYSQGLPKVTNRRYVVTLAYPLEIYHVDWSPDSRFIAYSVGGRGTRMQPAGYVVGARA